MENNPVSAPVQGSNFFSKIGPKQNPKKFFTGLIVFFAIIATGAFLSSNVGNNPTPPSNPTTGFTSLSNNSVAYGYWTENNSKIDAVDLENGKIYSLATLGKDIKKVTVVSSQGVVFLNKTDGADRGKELAAYNFSNKSTRALFAADPGFGIDDYVISPNKRYIADWEVQSPTGGSGLIGGKSKVYTIDLQNSGQKNLIYDETIVEGVPMHYPIGITDSGEVFLDGFTANAGTGWAGGMAYSNFAGTSKQEIAAMAKGTYSSQPVMSPDGRYIVFAGYTGTAAMGVQETGGVENAYLTPNSIEILDTVSKERKRLSALPSSNLYQFPYWGDLGKIVYTQVSRDGAQDGLYSYDIQSSIPSKIAGFNSSQSLISFLYGGKILGGQSDSSSVGNLGSKYTPLLGSLFVFDQPQNKSSNINTGITTIQYLGLFSAGYFGNAQQTGSLDQNGSLAKNNQLQLETLDIKPNLAPEREAQQSQPSNNPQCAQYGNGKDENGNEIPIPDYCIKCEAVAKEQCNSLVGKLNATNNIAWHSCFSATKDALNKSGVCYDSPLYLYGKEGTNVDITIGTKITKPVPVSNGNYTAVLGKRGQFEISGKNYSSIGFGYFPAIDVPKMTYGRVVKKEDVSATLEEYGKKLGLNTREISDLKNSIKFTYPYIWVSFYNDEVSKKILPISFNPEPNVYRNIVFYFKLLDAPISVPEPKFAPIPERKGFTAVEISHTVE